MRPTSTTSSPSFVVLRASRTPCASAGSEANRYFEPSADGTPAGLLSEQPTKTVNSSGSNNSTVTMPRFMETSFDERLNSFQTVRDDQPQRPQRRRDRTE